MSDTSVEPATDPVLVNTPETPKPGAGGMVPARWVPTVVGILAAVATAVAEAMQLPDHTAGSLVGAAIKALVVGIAAWFGGQSAGPRNPS